MDKEQEDVIKGLFVRMDKSELLHLRDVYCEVICFLNQNYSLEEDEGLFPESISIIQGMIDNHKIMLELVNLELVKKR